MDGLSSLKYIDKVRGGAKGVEDRDKVTVSSEVDRIYCNVPDKIQLSVDGNTRIAIEKSGLKDTGKET